MQQTSERGQKHLDTTISEMQLIFEQCSQMLGQVSLLEGLLASPNEGQTYDVLDAWLKELMENAQNIKSDVLSTWLRASYSSSDYLPHWQPLLHVSHRVMLERHPRNIVEGDLLSGLLGESDPIWRHNSRK